MLMKVNFHRMTVSLYYRKDRLLRALRSRSRVHSQLPRVALRCSCPFVRKIKTASQVNLQAVFTLLTVFAQFIPHSPNRLYHIAFFTQFIPKLLHMCIYRSCIAEVIVVPHVV